MEKDKRENIKNPLDTALSKQQDTHFLDHIHQLGLRGVLSKRTHDSSQFLCCNGACVQKKGSREQSGMGPFTIKTRRSYPWDIQMLMIWSDHNMAKRRHVAWSDTHPPHSPVGPGTILTATQFSQDLN